MLPDCKKQNKTAVLAYTAGAQCYLFGSKHGTNADPVAGLAGSAKASLSGRCSVAANNFGDPGENAVQQCPNGSHPRGAVLRSGRPIYSRANSETRSQPSLQPLVKGDVALGQEFNPHHHDPA